MPSFEGNFLTQQYEICSQETRDSTLSYGKNPDPESLSHLQCASSVPGRDRQTDRIPIANTRSQQYLPVRLSRVKKPTKIWTIDLKKNLNLKNLSSAGKRTARFLLAGACDSYVSCFDCVESLRLLRCDVALDGNRAYQPATSRCLRATRRNRSIDRAARNVQRFVFCILGLPARIESTTAVHAAANCKPLSCQQQRVIRMRCNLVEQ